METASDTSPDIAPGTRNPSPTTLGELARLFLRLGFTAFGGPAAHIAMMKEEVVNRRRWMTEAEFLDLLGAVNLIPGPNSTELAIHIGFQRGRWWGLVLAGVCFIFPATVIVSALAWGYAHYGRLPSVAGFLYAVKPVIIAVIVQAIWGLIRPAVKTRTLGIIGALALGLALLGVDELLLLFGAGAVTGVLRWAAPPKEGEPRPAVRSLVLLVAIAAGMGTLPSLLTRLGAAPTPAGDGAVPFGLASVFLFFLKVGSVLYGSGYVLLAFLRDGLVDRWHWLTSAQLLDATAVGQVTPGPVFTTATFIGLSARRDRQRRLSRHSASSCRRSCLSRSAARWCRVCERRRSRARFSTGSMSPRWR
jgi:chromate transporter